MSADSSVRAEVAALDVHPACAAFPMLDDDDLSKLAA